MSEQNLKNNARFIPLWHFITPLALLALLIGSIVNLLHADEHTHYSAALIVVIAIMFFIF